MEFPIFWATVVELEEGDLFLQYGDLLTPVICDAPLLIGIYEFCRQLECD